PERHGRLPENRPAPVAADHRGALEPCRTRDGGRLLAHRGPGRRRPARSDPALRPAGREDRGAVEVLDGATGKRRWPYTFPKLPILGLQTGQWASVIAGPDLDGDGRREVFLASSCVIPGKKEEARLFVEALSGQDGRPLWRWSHPSRGSYL